MAAEQAGCLRDRRVPVDIFYRCQVYQAHFRTGLVINAFSRTASNRKLFRQPRPGRRLGEKNDAVVQQSLLDTSVIGGAGGPRVVLALPETDGAFIYPEGGAERALGEPCQNTGGAELAPCDKVLAVSSHDNLHCSCDTSLTAPQISIKQRIKCALDGLVVMLPARVEQPFPDQGCDLGLPDLKRQAAQPGASAGAVQTHARHRCGAAVTAGSIGQTN